MRRAGCLLAALLFVGSASAQTGIVVVGNLAEADAQLERHEVRNLYMGSLRRANMQPVALSPEHPSRVVFNTQVIGLTEQRIQAFWAQMRFSGRGRPPREFSSTQALVNFLLETPGAVGYLSTEDSVPSGLTVLYDSN